MFSGIVESLGQITHIKDHQPGLTWTVCWSLTHTLSIGDSISINGICLTVTHVDKDSFMVDLVPETLQKTNVQSYKIGDHVNLERSLLYGGRTMGHMVQGHIDETLPILAWESQHFQTLLRLPRETYGYNLVVLKGFIAIDGMSLTIADLTTDYFDIAIIPHTRSTTIAKHYAVGRSVNIEYDMMGKYVNQYMQHYMNQDSTKI